MFMRVFPDRVEDVAILALILVDGVDSEDRMADFRSPVDDAVIDGAVELRRFVIHVANRHFYSVSEGRKKL